MPFSAYEEVQAGPVHGIPLHRAALNVVRLLIGTGQALGVLRRHKPGVILSTGGWVSFPLTLAGWLLRVPVVIYLPDIEPGLTIRILRRFAAQVAVTTPDSLAYFRQGQGVVTGYPLRPALLSATREQGIAHFQLDPAKKTLLVFGGSRGAQSINIALLGILPDLLARGDVQVIHVTGTLDWDRTAPHRDTPGYHAFAYLHDDMALAFACADLAICRAGASVLGELPHFALPSILVPYPHAWRYQKVNADYLAQKGAAIRMDDEHMAQALLPQLNDLFDHPPKLAAMRDCAGALAQSDAAGRIYELLARTAGGQPV